MAITARRMTPYQPIRAIAIFFAFLLFAFLQTHFVFAVDYEVGPNKTYKAISQVPLDSLEPGDVVKIYYRKKAYHEKFIIRRSGTKDKPIIIKGIPLKGKQPVIDGSLACQGQDEHWPQSGRWLIKVGDGNAADYVQIKNLELCNANNSQQYRKKESNANYEDNAAGIFIRLGRNVLIANCVIHSCGNGIQTTYGPDVSYAKISGCLIYDNGNHTNLDSSQEHNVYLCGTHTTVQFCRFGVPHSDGNNIKDRGLDTIIRYNWIEGGKNRQLDLVDHKEYGRADAYVYGNVIIQGREVNNDNMIHWGGDSGNSRSGTLYLFNNTIVGKLKKTRFIVVRYPDCNVEMKNNVFIGTGRLWNGKGSLYGSNNWFSYKIDVPPILNLGKQGNQPGFLPSSNLQYIPALGSPLINRGTNKVPKRVEYMPKPFAGGTRRPKDGRIDIGAFEAIYSHK
ncbi:MAG: hypothetical protein KKI12_05340 [Proteobacteria bacterium]|nr:hypothetical protein [Pseudomonadota bacterium]MBU4415281.1 hypothetical protein [Pseudomonadota bacterium]MCG2830129.1 hypothetical protein [Desulfobacteraceae bacterium]